VGVGGFKRAYADRVHFKGKDPKKAASHNTPVTVAAETGLVGLGLFAWLMVAVLVRAFRRRGQTALVAGLGLAAILVHSLFYNAFFEDPMTWALFGLVALTARVPASEPEPDAAEAPAKEAVPV
jgi:O-antigen ligase